MSGSYNAGAIDASLRLDRSEFNRELTQAKRDAEEFQKKTYTPKVTFDDTEAKAKIAALKQELQNLHNITVQASLSGFDGAATRLTALQAQADHLNGMVITIHADVDTRAAAASLAALRIAAADPITLRADVDTRVAAASLAALRRAAADPITIRTTTTGTPGTPGTPTPTPGGGPDDGDGETRRFRKIKDPLPDIPLGSLFSLPGLIASVLPQLPALTTMLLGATAAVASFGVAAGGALGIYGAATMGAVKNATAHEKAVKATDKALQAAQARLAGTTAGTTAYKNALKAVTEAEKAHKKALDDLTPSEKKFTDSLNGTQTAWQKFIKSTEVYTLKPVTTVLDGATAALPKFIPLIKDLAPFVQQVADGFKGWVTDGGLDRFIKFLQTTGVPVLKDLYLGLTGLLTAGGSLIRGFAPVALQMSGWFRDMGDSVATWANNGGVDRFREHFTQSIHQVMPIFQGLWGIIKDIWDILNGTGQSNADALVGIIDGIATAVGNIKPAAVKAFGEIFQAISDVAIQLAPVIGITSQAIVDIVNALPPGTIRAIADAMIAWKLAILGWNAAVLVWGAITAIIEGLSLAWATLSFVFAATPLGVIITIGAIVAGVILLIATKTTWFQTLWHFVWGGISAAASWAWKNVLQPTFHGIWEALKEVGKWGMWLWTHALKPAWDGISAGASWLWTTILKPVFSAIASGFETVGKILWKVYTTYLKVLFIVFAAAVKALWVFVLKPIFGLILAGWDGLVVGIKWGWNHILKPTWDGVAEGAKWVWTHALKPAFGWIKAGWDGVVTGVKWGWNHILKPVWDFVAEGASSLWHKHISPVFNGIKDTISGSWSWIKKNVFSPMGTFFTKTIPGWGTTMKDGLVSAFDTAWKGIQKVWNNVKKAIGTPIYWVARYVWNDAIYTIMDKIAGFVHQKNPLGKINTDKIPHFAKGGPVQGGTPGKDSVHAMLMPDEHVLTTADVAAMGGQRAVLNFRSALHGGKPVQGANDTGQFGLGGYLADAGSSLKSAVGDGLGALKDAALGALGAIVNPIINKAEGTIDKLVPGSGDWSNLAAGVMKQPLESIKKFIGKEDAKVQFSGGVIPTGQHLAIINAALRAAGVPPPGTKAGWQAGLNTLITRESGWNASAINLTDSNAKAGHPSQGLAQTIPGTFKAYHVSGTSNNILDPVANVAAAIRYIVARYGNISNVQQANGTKPPQGYWTGTSGAAPGMAWVGERGPELINFHGGETVYNNSDSMKMLRDGVLGGLHGYASGTKHQRTVVRRAYNERDDDTDRRNAAQKKYNEAHTKYLNATTVKEQQAAKKEMEKYAKKVASANKEIAADNKLIKLNEKRYKDASKAVQSERKDAETLAAARKKLMNKELADARNFIASKKAAIDAKIATATDARNGYYDTAVQTGQLSNLTGNRAAGFSQQLQAKIKAIKDFQTNLHTLAKLGLSRALIQQIAAMGPDQGGQLAQSLARTTTKADAKKLNSEYSELQKVSGQYADSAADDGFGLSKLKKESAVLSKAKITVTAPHTILVNIGGKTFKAHTEKVVEEKVTEIVAAAGKKK